MDADPSADDPQDLHRRAKQVMANLQDPFATLNTLAEGEALLAALAAYRDTFPQDSAEAEQVTNRLTTLRLLKNVKWCVVADTPLTEGHQHGKRLLTFADGTQAIFKPAWREGGQAQEARR